jgi:hypothetical protein
VSVLLSLVCCAVLCLLLRGVSVNVLELLFVALSYLHTHPIDRTPEDFAPLFQDLDQCHREWHRAGKDLTGTWAERLPDMRRAAMRAIVTTLADRIYKERANSRRTAAFGQLDMHGVFENRTRDLEQKAQQETGVQGAKVEVYASATRCLSLCWRVFTLVDIEMDILRAHRELIAWTKGYGGVLHVFRQLSEFVITSETDNKLRELYVLRELPLGSVINAKRSGSPFNLQDVAQAELGDIRTRDLVTEATKACKEVVQSVQNQELTRLQECWLLVLLDRMFRTNAHVSWLHHFVILHQELVPKEHVWRKLDQFGIVRRPIILETMGQWCISNQQQLWHCTCLVEALYCWASLISEEPYLGKTMSGKDLSAYIQGLLHTPNTDGKAIATLEPMAELGIL